MKRTKKKDQATVQRGRTKKVDPLKELKKLQMDELEQVNGGCEEFARSAGCY